MQREYEPQVSLTTKDRQMLALHHIVWGPAPDLAQFDEAWGKLPDSPKCEMCETHEDLHALRNGSYLCGTCREGFHMASAAYALSGAQVTINDYPEPEITADQWNRLLAVCDSWQKEARFWRRIVFCIWAEYVVIAAVLLWWTLKG